MANVKCFTRSASFRKKPITPFLKSGCVFEPDGRVNGGMRKSQEAEEAEPNVFISTKKGRTVTGSFFGL